ncbi:hypothetical protein PQG02_24755 [Nostoc sp. UHCC 0926]|uniref:hypothetical protein n=1 Tax=Nostoc sp. TaxID=1180 RepID=UPI00279C8856|nr:hypothetical protein PQG02_24755 [Nostoc sp. UHCC 0926]
MSQRSGEGVSTPLDGSCFSLQPFGHPTAGVSLSQCDEGETHKGQVEKPLGRTASFMPLNPSTAVAPHE